MRRFVAEQNVRHFERILASETDPDQRTLVTELLAEAERELTVAEHECAELEKVARSSGAVFISGAIDAQRRFSTEGSD